MYFNVVVAGTHKGLLTTEHPTSSFGVPVLIIDGKAFGPGEPFRTPGPGQCYTDWMVQPMRDVYISRLDSLIPDFDPFDTATNVDYGPEREAESEFQRLLTSFRGAC
jgi:hypothetical protein